MFSSQVQRSLYEKQIEDDFDVHSFVTLQLDDSNPTKLDLKRVFYRRCTLFVSALGRWLGTESSSCLKILHELLEKSVLLEEDCHKLKFAVALCCEIRLKFYLKNNNQSDHVLQTHFLPQQPETKYLADAVGTKGF